MPVNRTAAEVVDYILYLEDSSWGGKPLRPISYIWRLHKLLYYCQAWYLVWEEYPLFDDRIEAWANGPVIPYLYEKTKGLFRVSEIAQLSEFSLFRDVPEDRGIGICIKKVLKYYQKKDDQTLTALVLQERPWREARQGLDIGERGSNEITHEALAEYYCSLI